MVYSNPEPQFVRVSAILIEGTTQQRLSREAVDYFRKVV